jgi:hypothetical protein
MMVPSSVTSDTAMARIPGFSIRHSGIDGRSAPRTGQWHAIEIRCGKRCCEAAQAAAGKRYLAAEAPSLPLPNCDRRGRCDCRYQHHADRRGGPRRAADGAFASPPTATETDRRRAGGRREEDGALFDVFDVPDDSTPSVLEDTYYDYVNKSKLLE